jgi:hypothetical protein
MVVSCVCVQAVDGESKTKSAAKLARKTLVGCVHSLCVLRSLSPKDCAVDLQLCAAVLDIAHLYALLSQYYSLKSDGSLYDFYTCGQPPAVSKQVLDLDETLIHSVHMQRLNTAQQCDLKLEIYIDGKLCRFFVYFRPHAQLFLETVAEWFVNHRGLPLHYDGVQGCVSTLRYTLQQQYQLQWCCLGAALRCKIVGTIRSLEVLFVFFTKTISAPFTRPFPTFNNSKGNQRLSTRRYDLVVFTASLKQYVPII